MKIFMIACVDKIGIGDSIGLILYTFHNSENLFCMRFQSSYGLKEILFFGLSQFSCANLTNIPLQLHVMFSHIS